MVYWSNTISLKDDEQIEISGSFLGKLTVDVVSYTSSYAGGIYDDWLVNFQRITTRELINYLNLSNVTISTNTTSSNYNDIYFQEVLNNAPSPMNNNPYRFYTVQ